MLPVAFSVFCALPPAMAGVTGENGDPLDQDDYAILRSKVAAGVATMAEVHAALTERDTDGIADTMHALYSLRWSRMAHALYDDLWLLHRDGHPDFAWRQIEAIPARIALAGTLARIRGRDAKEFLAYIHAHKYDTDGSHRAQAVIALGRNGDPGDVDYLIEMAGADSVYVAQSAATALALVGHPRARDELIRLWGEEKDEDKKAHLARMLLQAYAWQSGGKPVRSKPPPVKPGTKKRLR